VSRRTGILAAAAVLGVLAFALGRGEDTGGRVQSLEADPMARYVPPGGKLVDTDSQGHLLGKPATYARLFQLTGAGSARALADARAKAEAAGWTEVHGATARLFTADKRTPSGGSQLVVKLFEDSILLPKGVKPPALLVSLRRTGP
jgi:hypothetical protein